MAHTFASVALFLLWTAQCISTVSGWSQGQDKFEPMLANGWCVDSAGAESVSRSFAQGDSCRQNCDADHTCPAYAGPNKWGWCVWYTDKNPQVAGRSALTFVVTGSAGVTDAWGWETATCFRKSNQPVDDETILSPPYLGCFTVTQAPLQCKPSHCEGNGNGYAVDWGMPKGTPIIASRGGIVEEVIDVHGDGGACTDALEHHANLVNVRHSDGTVAVYLHLLAGTAKVKVGDQVTRGTQLAESGSSGCSLGPHLHFHVRGKDSWKTVPVHFDWPCQKIHDAVPKFSEQLCNTAGCDPSATTTPAPSCFSGAPASLPAHLRTPWNDYCASTWTPSFWVMDENCGAAWYGSSEADALKQCDNLNTGSPCKTFDNDRSHCTSRRLLLARAAVDQESSPADGQGAAVVV